MRSKTPGVFIVAVCGLLSLGGCPCDYDCVITTQQLPPAAVGVEYTTQLRARISERCSASGTTDFEIPGERSATWRIVGGALPAGLQLGGNGVLSGVPSTSGSFRISVAAVCGAIDTPSQDLDILVRS